jgi:hypothetical protein
MLVQRIESVEAPLTTTEVLTAYEAGELVSVATRDELEKLRVAARATGTKDRRVSFGCRWPTCVGVSLGRPASASLLCLGSCQGHRQGGLGVA